MARRPGSRIGQERDLVCDSALPHIPARSIKALLPVGAGLLELSDAPDVTSCRQAEGIRGGSPELRGRVAVGVQWVIDADRARPGANMTTPSPLSP
jgi:hypothetical protein